jgi:histone deacetylase 11
MVLLFRSDSTVRFDLLSSKHPFEIDRSGQVHTLLKQWYGADLDRISISFSADVNDKKLLYLAHDSAYIDDHLSNPSAIARTFQWPSLADVPIADLKSHLLQPLVTTVRMVSGALDRSQLTNESIFCLSGGYHHASYDSGGGFCLFSDIAVAITKMRSGGRLRPDDKVLYIDTDAHFADGVAKFRERDPRLIVLDVFNQNAFPMLSRESLRLSRQIDFAVPLPQGTGDEEYLGKLSVALGKLKNSLAGSRKPPFAIYTAGVDPFCNDRLGGLKLSKAGLAARDTMVFDFLRELGIRRIVLPGGGYCAESAELYANCIATNGIKGLLPRIDG